MADTLEKMFKSQLAKMPAEVSALGTKSDICFTV